MAEEEYVDINGVQYITASRVAQIWNERAKTMGFETNYTRWSVKARRGKPKGIDGVQTPLGYLYTEEAARKVELHPSQKKRPDVAAKNKSRAAKDIPQTPEIPPIENTDNNSNTESKDAPVSGDAVSETNVQTETHLDNVASSDE